MGVATLLRIMYRRLLLNELLAILQYHTLEVLRNFLTSEVVARSVSIIGSILNALNIHFFFRLARSEGITLETNLRITLEEPIGLASLGINDDITPEVLVTSANNPRITSLS